MDRTLILIFERLEIIFLILQCVVGLLYSFYARTLPNLIGVR
jgi:hypothetical protein